MYDTSDFPKEHPLWTNANKKVLGKMKDEYAAMPISEDFMRPKMYSILKADEKNIKKEKGVKKSVLMWHGMNILRSEGHEIFGMHVNKVSLSPFDSKRWIADDGIHTNASLQ